MNQPTLKDYVIGERVRVYQTDFCRNAPDDLILDEFQEGVIQSIAPKWEGSKDFTGKYLVDRVMWQGEPRPQSGMLGTIRSFTMPSYHVVPMKMVNEQLELVLNYRNSL